MLYIWHHPKAQRQGTEHHCSPRLKFCSSSAVVLSRENSRCACSLLKPYLMRGAKELCSFWNSEMILKNHPRYKNDHKRNKHHDVRTNIISTQTNERTNERTNQPTNKQTNKPNKPNKPTNPTNKQTNKQTKPKKTERERKKKKKEKGKKKRKKRERKKERKKE